jgi:glycosyltransferase involved in cell wall biosynthesis
MTSQSPAVSVIMSMRNASETVGDAIRSLQWQTESNWELILFDDGSEDDSVGVVQSIADPRIRVSADGRRMGLAARLNQAVELAQGRFVARMDADDICFPTRFEKQLAYLESHPRVDLLASRAVVFSGDGLIGVLPVGIDHGDVVRHPFRGFPFPHPTWCGRQEWFRANPYDASLGKTQDQDLLLRSYRNSIFAGLGEVLLGYRQPQLELRKLLRGRLIFSQSVWRQVGKSAPLAPILDGIASQAVKAATDIATIGLGFNRWSQRRRLVAVPGDVRVTWQSLCDSLHCDQGA